MHKYIICPICKKEYKRLTIQHIQSHGYTTTNEFKNKFGLKTVFSEEEINKTKIYSKKNNVQYHFKEYYKTHGNPMHGRNHTKETINKIKRHRKGKGIGISGKYIRTKEIKIKISRGVAKTHRNYTYGKYNEILAGTEKTFPDKSVIIRSSWEKRIFVILETHPLVTKIVIEPFQIPYIFEDQERIYIPDFYFEWEYGAIKELWEIKPKWAMKYPRNKAKIKALNNYAFKNDMNSHIITQEKEIERLEYSLGIDYDKELKVSFIMSSFNNRDLFKEALNGKRLSNKTT
ncbi:MAG TPA: TnsA endonuclease N-terminal domain-containing protein [Candidatus Glassbacteria bacterium]|nr:TnsA endonuclease N-terminal domain-containing protein [Candidatus Glassbacteria bacterium]